MRKTTIHRIAGLLGILSLFAAWLAIRQPAGHQLLPRQTAVRAPIAVPGNLTELRDCGVTQDGLPGGGSIAPKPSAFTGEAARFELQKAGQSESLGAALAAARHAVEKIDPSGPSSRGAEYFAANPEQRLRVWFSNVGVELASGQRPADENAEPWSVALRLRGVGREGTVKQVATGGARAAGNRVEVNYPTASLTQWFENRKEGLEQGFTLTEPPAGTAEEVTVMLDVAGNLHPEAMDGKGGVRLLDATNAEVLHYTGLKAWDASGRMLASRMEVRGLNSLALVVVDGGAQYPITIDPLFANVEARLVKESTAGDEFGSSVAISGDTALVGARNDSTALEEYVGSAYVFVFEPSRQSWTMQAKLTADDGAAGDFFGENVALSGETALIGAAEHGEGRAYVFVRNGTVWSQQAKLTSPDPTVENWSGIDTSVALAGDTALLGVPKADTAVGNSTGAAYVFVRSGTVWGLQAKLVAGDAAVMDNFGYAVALSGDSALVGAQSDDTAVGTDAGSAYIFIRNGTVWSQQAKLTPADAAVDDYYGSAVALSGDTALVGMPGGITGGSAYVFVRNGTEWTQRTKLTAADATGWFGRSVALSDDTALVGAWRGAYVFVFNGTVWSQHAKVTAASGAVDDDFGCSVALAGNTALVGAQLEDTTAEIDAGSAYVFSRNGEVWNQVKLSASRGAFNVNLGQSVALSGDTALVGVPNDETVTGIDAGSAYVFVRDGAVWSQQAKLTQADYTWKDTFGISVALEGDTALIGASGANTPLAGAAGSAYVFVRNGAVWSQQTKLVANDGANHDYFGRSVALSGDNALVGAYYAGTPVADAAGSAYVFVRSGAVWSQQAKLTATDGAVYDFFGCSVAISGDTALVGAAGIDLSARNDVGSAYVFVRNGAVWSQQAKLTQPDYTWNDSFGCSVALSGDTALVGANNADTPTGVSAGGAYVFARNGAVWSQQAKLTAIGGVEHDHLGASVALSGDTALVGADNAHTSAGAGAGSAYVFVRSGALWSQQVKLTAGLDASTNDNFGRSVALSGDTALVGSPHDDTADVDAGSVYAFLIGDLPEIMQHPKSQTVVPGQSVTFSITAGGYEPLHYQWRKDGYSIASANGTSYMIPAAQLSDQGNYDCVVSNVGGTATSAPALLTVDTLSQFEQLPPGAPPASKGIVVVTISPPGIGGAWRFLGEQEWRDSGTAAQGLATGDRVVEFRPITGYQQPLPEPVAVIGDGTVRILNANYSWNGLAGSGRVEVILKPDDLVHKPDDLAHDAQWRFVGEDDLRWRTSGTVASGLVPGNYLIECKPVAGRAIPPPANVVVGNNTTATLRLVYSLATNPNGLGPVEIPPDTISANTGFQTKVDLMSGYPPTAPGALKVILGPAEVDAKGAAWRIQPAPQYYRSGSMKTNLPPGSYKLYLTPVAGFPAPPEYTVNVSGGALTTVTYHYASDPAAFVGQLRSATGSGSGFVVKRRVVATAGHVVFDDATLSAATGLEWLFQRDRGNYDPLPLTPRGFLLLDGYAAQRATEGTPGTATPASQERDMAAVWFYQDAGRGGFGGFLASDAADNEWLISDATKTLAGYPVVGIAADKVGRIHTTPLMNVQFTRVPGESRPGLALHLYATSDIYTTRGNSGGPLCVQSEGGAYYPAAIYIGGSNQTIIRSIDSEVVGLFNRAEFQSFGGDNSVGGGVTLSSYASFGTDSSKGALTVLIEPAAASAAPAGWRLSTESSWRYPGTQLSGMAPGTYLVDFAISNDATAGKYLPAAPQQVVIVGGKILTITFTFAKIDDDSDGDGRTNREEIIAGTDPKNASDFLKVLAAGKSETGFTLSTQGRAGRVYALQRTISLSSPSWYGVATLGPLAADGPVALTDTMAPSGKAFYRIQVIMP